MTAQTSRFDPAIVRRLKAALERHGVHVGYEAALQALEAALDPGELRIERAEEDRAIAALGADLAARQRSAALMLGEAVKHAAVDAVNRFNVEGHPRIEPLILDICAALAALDVEKIAAGLAAEPRDAGMPQRTPLQ